MTRRRRKTKTGPGNGLGGMLAFSLALHLVFFFWASRLELFRSEFPQTAQAIYVDVVTLPVASPQAGSPAGAVKGAPAAAGPPAPVLAPPPAPREMKLPTAKTVPAKTAPVKTAKAPVKKDAAESPREYEARLAALEQAAEARRQEATLAAIRNRAGAGKAGAAPAGMPGGTGSQAGSDYAAYLQSRLRDSFALTIARQTRKPLVAVRLTVDARGALLSYKIEMSTGDVLFEDAVVRAIQLAKKNFPSPPGGREFSYGFVFKPEGVDKK